MGYQSRALAGAAHLVPDDAPSIGTLTLDARAGSLSWMKSLWT